MFTHKLPVTAIGVSLEAKQSHPVVRHASPKLIECLLSLGGQKDRAKAITTARFTSAESVAVAFWVP